MPFLPRRGGRRAWRRLGPWLLFGLLAAIFAWPLWAPNPADRMSIGRSGGDFLRQFHAYRAFVAGAWASGHPPLWNPHQYAGSPAWADPQLAVIYPWRLLQLPFALGDRILPLWTLHLEALAHLMLAASFTYGLVRRLGAGPAGGLLAGLSFAFGGYLSGYPMEQLAILDTAAWIPALLWALTALAEALRPGIDRAFAGAGRRAWLGPALAAAGAGAMMVLAGHPQTALYGFWAAAAWWIYRLWRLRRAGPGTEPLPADPLPSKPPPPVAAGGRQPWLLASAVWILGAVGLSALQWLPSVDLLGRSARQLDPAEVAAGFPLVDILQVVAPGGLSQWSPLYLGFLPLALALWGGLRLPASRPWLGMAATAWLIGLGGNNPAFPLLLRILPGMALFRHQERIAVLWSLGLAVAAGLSLSALLAGRSRTAERPDRPLRELTAIGAGAALLLALAAAALQLRYAGAALPLRDFCSPEGLAAAAQAVPPTVPPAGRRLALAGPMAHVALYAACTALAAGLALAGRLPRRWLASALLLLALLDLFGANRGAALCPLDPDRLLPDANLAQLLPRARDGRVSSEALLPGGPNAASLFGLYDVTGDSPLRLGSTENLVEQAPEILWWRILGVRFAVSQRPPEGAPLTELSRAGDAVLYEVELPVPPLWLPPESRCLAPGTPIAEWAEPSLDPLRVAYVEPVDPARSFSALEVGRYGMPTEGSADDRSAGICWSDASPDRPGGSASLTGLDPGRIRAEAELAGPGWLLLSSAYDPAWQLSARELDTGERIRPPVARAYGAILAARLPAGRWELRWTYLPAAVIMGLLTSLSTLGAGLWLWRRAARAST